MRVAEGNARVREISVRSASPQERIACAVG
jgi:hypothetical protein